MQLGIKNYKVKVIREAGSNPVTGQLCSYADQEMSIDATSQEEAYRIAQSTCNLHFTGQIRRTFIDGVEYFNRKY